jgi:hypothetical protein
MERAAGAIPQEKGRQESVMIKCVLFGGRHEIKWKMKMTNDGTVETVEREG